MRFELTPSKFFRAIFLCFAALASASIFYFSLCWWQCVVLQSVLLLYVLYVLWRYCTQRCVWQVTLIELRATWLLTQRNGRQLTAQLDKHNSVVTRYLVVLKFKAARRRYYVPVFFDRLGAEAMRQLRREVLLR